MKKIERILAMIVLLLDNEVVSTAQLAQRFDVSKRTIFRDIETIELAGFPIISHAGRNGGFSLVNSFKLRTYTYSREEKQDIINALNVKESLFGSVGQNNMIKEKIALMQDTTNKEKKLKKSFSFESPTMHRLEIESETKEKINYINLALKQNNKLVINYVDNKGEYTERTIHPYELMLMNGSWYIFSYCETRAAFRYFKVTRIRQLTIQQTTFESVGYSNKKQIESEEKLIHLRFRKEDLGKLYDYYTEDEMQVTETHIDVRIYTVQRETIVPFLLMFGNGVNVIAPNELKERHKEAIIRLQETY